MILLFLHFVAIISKLSFVLDVICWFIGKGELIEFTKDGQPSNYLVVELDDLLSIHIVAVSNILVYYRAMDK